MSTAQKLQTTEDYKVADISLAQWGRRELEIRRKRNASADGDAG